MAEITWECDHGSWTDLAMVRTLEDEASPTWEHHATWDRGVQPPAWLVRTWAIQQAVSIPFTSTPLAHLLNSACQYNLGFS